MKKKLFKRKQKVVKGTSSAVVLSILIHAGLFFLAGALVIFKVLNPPAVEFKAPPPVKVPKMPLKKLTPKVKKPSKPKSTAKIVAVVEKVDLNQIQFPDLASSGIGTGISEGADVVSFGEMPTFEDGDGLLGKVVSIGNDLEGTYYDVKRRRNGTYNGEGAESFRAILNEFFEKDWAPMVFSRFYRSPQKRYATCVMVPTMSSSFAPAAFGEDAGSGLFWIVHYKGKIVYPEDITFRFWGVGDEVLAVRLDGKEVFADVWYGDLWRYPNLWRGYDSKRKTYRLGHDTTMEVGDWVTLKAGEPQDIDIVVGDNGGLAVAMLLVEVKGVDYPQNIQGGPILPVFKTSTLSHDLIDRIYVDLAENECCLTNGPVFSDYGGSE